MMNRKCPTCGRQLGPVGECLDCGGSNEKKIGLIEALMITVVVIGLLGAIGFGISKIVGNPFQVKNRLKLRQKEIYEVSAAAEDLPISREPQKTLTLDQIEHLRELFENRQFAILNLKIEAVQQDFEDDFDNEYKLQDAFGVFATTLPFYEELFPHSFQIRSAYMNAITPRWGGSYRQMENFAKEAEPYAQTNPYLTSLYGYIYCDQAIDEYDRSLMFYPDNVKAHYWRGVAFSRLNEPDLALADLERAIELDPRYFNAYAVLDYTLFQRHELDKIVQYWNQFIELEPNHPRAYLERSGTYYHKKDFANALKDLKKSCELGNQEACTRYDPYKDRWAG